MKITSEDILNALSKDLGYTAPFITSDMDAKEAAKVALKNAIVKKLVDAGSAVTVEQRAVQKWIDLNEACKAEFTVDSSSYYADILYDFKELMYSSFDSSEGKVLTLNACLEHAAHGPGVSQGSRYTDFFSKAFGDGMSMYDEDTLYPHYRHSIFTRWKIAESIRYNQYGLNVVKSSGLFTVPKNNTIARCALKEASLNLFYQLGAGRVIESILQRDHGIFLDRQQSVNGDMACNGSVVGNYATLDLESASDTLRTSFVAWSLDSFTYATLNRMRSKTVILPNGEERVIHMFSSMGNGFNFPLQTLIFATLVKAVYRNLGLPLRDLYGKPTYSVNGDDIIVLNKAVYQLSVLLGLCGFKVNDEKSFLSGPFRESCGKDFFKGQNIRPVYIKRISHESHGYSAFNRLCRWSARWGIDISHTLLLFYRAVRFRPIPFDEDDSGGIKCPLYYWRGKAYVHPGKDERYPYGGWAYDILKKDTVFTRIPRRNQDGIIISIIGRYLNSDGSSKFEDPVLGCTRVDFFKAARPSSRDTFRIERRLTHSWDWLPYVGLTIQEVDRVFICLDWCALRK